VCLCWSQVLFSLLAFAARPASPGQHPAHDLATGTQTAAIAADAPAAAPSAGMAGPDALAAEHTMGNTSCS
jgi:hypothetical protein